MTASQADSKGLVLYSNATFITNDPNTPRAQAMLVEDERIKQVYAEPPKQPPALARKVDLGGSVVVPGLVDAHLHLAALGAKQREVDLVGCRSAAEAVDRVRAFVEDNAEQQEITGFGWDQSLWTPRKFPQKALLDSAFGDRVIVLYRIDGHMAWVSSKALELAGITELTEDPSGGKIERDKDGLATGILVDNAMDLVSSKLPGPSPQMLENDLLYAVRHCAALGLTAVHDMGSSIQTLEILRILERRGDLPIRVFVYLADGGEPTMEYLPSRQRRSLGLIEVRGIKLFADGALGSRGAALKKPYADDKKNTGLVVTEAKILEERVRQVQQRGYQVAIHAIGDRGNLLAIEAIAGQGKAAKQARHRIEHAQILDPKDIPAFAKVGIIASMQPTHATSDMRWAEARLGKRRLAGAYAWRSVLDSNAVLAFGSDAPIESADFRLGLFAAVHRTDHQGKPRGGWLPKQKLDRWQALRAFTLGPSYAVGREHELGKLRENYLADFTVLSLDPTAGETKLLDIEVRRTIVGGTQVYRVGK